MFNYQKTEQLNEQKISELDEINHKVHAENITLKAEVSVLKDQLGQCIKKENY